MPATRLSPALPFLVLLSLPLGGCADGGLEERPQSEVQIGANHHLFWFRSLPGFGTFPVSPDVVNTGTGAFALREDSTYQLTPPSGPSATDRYALTEAGELSIFVSGSGREPGVVFGGSYRLEGVQPDMFFTDRVSAFSSTSVGVYYGTRVTPGQVELEGSWHVMSLHTMFGGSLTIPRNVGRAAFGEVTIGAGSPPGTPGTVRTISGSGQESGSDPSTVGVTFGGTIQNLLDGNGDGDGTCNLTLDYTTGGSTDNRVCRAAAGRDIVMALDQDRTDGESGIVFLVRKFDAPGTPADPAQIDGEFLIGGHTLFVNPLNAGSDAFLGRLVLSAQGGFDLFGEGHQGVDFTYSGTYTVAATGALTLSVNGTNETWRAVVNRSYDTVILVDPVVENRTNNTPELNLAIGIRVDDL